MRKLPLIAFLLLAALFTAALLTPHRAGKFSTAEGHLPSFALHSLDGKRQWDSASVQGKVTVLNFFASWCTPCAAEMPELAALKKDHPNLNLVGIVWNDTPKTLNPWLKKHGNPFTSTWLDADGNATIDLGVRGIPESLIIDHRGNIRHRLSAPLTESLRTGEIGELIRTLEREAADAK